MLRLLDLLVGSFANRAHLTSLSEREKREKENAGEGGRERGREGGRERGREGGRESASERGSQRERGRGGRKGGMVEGERGRSPGRHPDKLSGHTVALWASTGKSYRRLLGRRTHTCKQTDLVSRLPSPSLQDSAAKE